VGVKGEGNRRSISLPVQVSDSGQGGKFLLSLAVSRVRVDYQVGIAE